ncbi:hypothetical protein IMSHALPRED_002496 [Imshaugia aleurites]|uniref:Uncharacterized protein n=1 Tax=Imshaugia aleurites TaxID=172621 RepID=A0A8H3J5W8_9LECA|nr:hypothetical protein IMSHALPRED_002496 [Imshaugia aleurites]
MDPSARNPTPVFNSHSRSAADATAKPIAASNASRVTGQITRKFAASASLTACPSRAAISTEVSCRTPSFTDIQRRTFNDMLDDCFFLRIADRFNFTEDKRCKGGNMNKFREFLDLAEERVGFLPPWWCEGKRGECERTAEETERMAPGSEDYDTRDFVIDHALIWAYRDYNIPTKLRLLAEKVYGTKIVLSW